MNLVLLGPPGAGKGTQAVKLAQKLRLPHISTGDILRQNVSQGTPLGIEAQGFMNRGELVPDTLVTSMLIDRLEQPDTNKGFILDGYPRNLSQAKALNDMLKQKNTDLDAVVYLDTSEKIIIQRICGRLVCKSCGANFHITNMPPKLKGVCDKCQGQLYQRSDDTEETVKRRLLVYQKEVSALIEYYKDKNKLHTICADEEAGIVLDKILLLAQEYNDSHKG